jgi:hypothetical protein
LKDPEKATRLLELERVGLPLSRAAIISLQRGSIINTLIAAEVAVARAIEEESIQEVEGMYVTIIADFCLQSFRKATSSSAKRQKEKRSLSLHR